MLLLFEGFDLLFAFPDFSPSDPWWTCSWPTKPCFRILTTFLSVRLPLFPRFFDAAEGFLLRRFALPLFDTAFALAATALTAFLAGGAAELGELAARPAIAPITPPTTAPTGPATLPRTAPAAAPAVCLEIGGISMFSDDEPDVSDDGDFQATIAPFTAIPWLVVFTTYWNDIVIQPYV